MESIEGENYIGYLKSRYHRVGRCKKTEILDEVCERLGIGRRQARRLLGRKRGGRPKKPEKRGRKGEYQDNEFKGSLRLMWKTTRYMCSRHLKVAMPAWVPFVEDEEGKFSDSVRTRLLKISPATMDRILKPFKGSKGISTTRSSNFRDEIPIQGNVWDVHVPGYLETDTVAHCGGSTMGEYINSLVMVDIATIWTEARAVYGKGSGPIVYAIEDIENFLPFEIRGYDSDNGTEILNQHVLRYFRDEREERGRKVVKVTRAKEYRKNDNAHVEQRNDSVARRYLGHERLDFRELQPLIDRYYKFIASPMLNHFFPTFKLFDKIRVKSRTRRVYKDPETPYARVMKSEFVPLEIKEHLEEVHKSLNPLALSNMEKQVRKQIDLAVRALKQKKDCKRLLTIPEPLSALLLKSTPIVLTQDWEITTPAIQEQDKLRA